MDYATDEERVEEIKKWWKENGKSVIFGIALGLSILGGWRYWQGYQLNQSEQASTLYSQLEKSVQQNIPEEVTAFSEEIFKKHENHIYAVYTALTMAKMRMDENKPVEAKKHLQWGLEHAQTDELKHLLTIRLARVYLSENELDKASGLVSNIEKNPFSAAYAELEGDILVKQGNMEQALSAYQAAAQTLTPGTAVNPSLQYKIDDLAKVQ